MLRHLHCRRAHVQIGPQYLTRYPGGRLHLDHTLGRHMPIPLPDGAVRDPERTRQARYRASLGKVIAECHALDGSSAPIQMQASLPPNDERRCDNQEMGETLPNETLPQALGRRLKSARERAKLTQRQLGIALDFESEHSAVGQWERGKELPTLSNLIRAAEYLPASLDELVWGMGNSLDARIRKLPAIFREPLIDLIEGEIRKAEGLLRRHPQLAGQVVLDEDAKLKQWSASLKIEAERKRKEEAEKMAGKGGKKRPPGRHSN